MQSIETNHDALEGPHLRIRRAMMYTPGSDEHKIQKASTLELDCVCLDLEDGVALNRKQDARHAIANALQHLSFGYSERLVRINRVGSGMEVDDLAGTIVGQPNGYVVPKVESARQVQWVSEWLTEAERSHGWQVSSIRILAVIETAKGIINLANIAGADPRLDVLLFGAMDFSADTGATLSPSKQELLYARSAVVVHAAAFGLQALDMVYVDFHDTEGLLREAYEGARMGFSGKQIIHPHQVQPTQFAYTPSTEVIAHARRVVQTFQSHQAGGDGAFVMDGKMVDMPVYRTAQLVLAKANAANRDLHRLTTLDQGTNLLNRLVFDESLNREWRRAVRLRSPLSVILCHVHFSHDPEGAIDLSGLDIGFQQIAETIRQTVRRPGDVVARYSEREVVLLLSDTNAEGATHVAGVIQSAVHGADIRFPPQFNTQQVSLNLGLVSLIPDHQLFPIAFMDAALRTMLDAKEGILLTTQL